MCSHRERFVELRAFLPGPDMDLETASRAARRLGMKPIAFRVAVSRLKKEFKDCLRRTVADTLYLDPEDPTAQAAIDRELLQLHRSLCPIEAYTALA
jgi:hypothetical protein